MLTTHCQSRRDTALLQPKLRCLLTTEVLHILTVATQTVTIHDVMLQKSDILLFKINSLKINWFQ